MRAFVCLLCHVHKRDTPPNWRQTPNWSLPHAVACNMEQESLRVHQFFTSLSFAVGFLLSKMCFVGVLGHFVVAVVVAVNLPVRHVKVLHATNCANV